MEVLEYAVLLAKSRNATLVSLSLIPVPKDRGARLEDVQQSKDFLEAVQQKAMRHGVCVERLEVFTSATIESINTVAQTMQIGGILLFVRDGEGVLLSTYLIKRLMEREAYKLYITRLQSVGSKRELFKRFSGWLAGLWNSQGNMVETEAPLEGDMLVEKVEVGQTLHVGMPGKE